MLPARHLGSVLRNRVTQRGRVRPGSNSLAYLTDGISQREKDNCMKTKSGMVIAGLVVVIVVGMSGPIASAGCGEPFKGQPSPVATWMSH
jgi:hypothetical protein